MFDALRQAIAETLEQHRQQPFLDAAMGACALVAAADGEVSLSEQSRVDDVLGAIERLALFDVHEAVDLFNEYVEGLVADPAKGRERALDAVGRMKGDPEAADLLVKICIAVSRADEDEAPSERAQIEAVCTRLGRDVSDYV